MSEFVAVKTLLEAEPRLAGRVVDTAVDNDGKAVRGTYLVLFGAGPERLDDQLWATIPRPDSDASYSIPLRAISDDAEGVRLLVNIVKQLVGAKPQIVGRRCDPLTIVFDPFKVDNNISPPLYFADMWIEFWSRRG